MGTTTYSTAESIGHQEPYSTHLRSACPSAWIFVRPKRDCTAAEARPWFVHAL